jgi:serine protease AprX
MNGKSQVSLPSKIYAEAIVHSVSGESLLRASSLVTSDNVTRFWAKPSLLNSTARRLHEAGFEILDIGKTSISIAAEPEVYERSLQTTLEAVELPVIKGMALRTTAAFINSVDDKPFGEIDTSKTSWGEVLDGIAINEPVCYFAPDIPAASPPQTITKYLSVPDGIAQGLNATLAHQAGIKGKGVKVVMVDTGWYPHPFFGQNNYNVNVVLAPGSTAPFQDDLGHGTGESANVFALAPEAELIMVKADVALDGEYRNVNSIAAFKKAVALQPDIISCSWGSDLRTSQLSPYNQVLAAVISDAVKQGIIVIFSAGNGHWGFPAQHPDVIAAGGVYKHLDGVLRGQLEASSYASGFVSPIYTDRRVPDVCGLVGQLPYAAYIMLPVPPNSQIDRNLSYVKDGTFPTDGWAAFSGTSAAAPQLAGICALIKQVAPNLSPAKVRNILQQTACDVVDGMSNPTSGRASARVGVDLSTGYGLADADAAVRAAKALDTGQCCEDCKSHDQSFSNTNSKSKRRKPMSNQFPKLQAKLDEIQAKFDEVLRAEFINNGDLIEDVELRITEINFVSRSPQTRAASSLRDILVKLPKINDQINAQEIKPKHVLAAESLIKMNRCQELATKVLIAAIQSEKAEVPELAAKALGEIKSDNYVAEQEDSSLFVSRPYYPDECERKGKPYPCGYKTERNPLTI